MIQIKNKYRITLFNSRWKEEFFTYDYPLLPNSGDIIEIFKSTDDLFFIKDRIFSIHNNGGLLHITLTGMMEDDDRQTRLSWDRFKEKLIESQKGLQLTVPNFDDYKNMLGEDGLIKDEYLPK